MGLHRLLEKLWPDYRLLPQPALAAKERNAGTSEGTVLGRVAYKPPGMEVGLTAGVSADAKKALTKRSFSCNKRLP